jgi:hypothetical protein
MDETIKRSPDKSFSCGLVKAAIWADSRVINNTLVEVHSIIIDRSYKDKDDGEWKYTTTFAAEDLPKVAVVAMEAYRWLRLRTFEPETSEVNNSDNAQDEQIDSVPAS